MLTKKKPQNWQADGLTDWLLDWLIDLDWLTDRRTGKDTEPIATLCARYNYRNLCLHLSKNPRILLYSSSVDPSKKFLPLVLISTAAVPWLSSYYPRLPFNILCCILLLTYHFLTFRNVLNCFLKWSSLELSSKLFFWFTQRSFTVLSAHIVHIFFLCYSEFGYENEHKETEDKFIF